MLKIRLRQYAKGLLALCRSNRTFWVLFVICGLEAVWIALSGRYSMAYDEYVHYGVINVYGHQWLPFFSGQPAGADAFGAISRDPSYLYHYLMSFPYRVFAHFCSSFVAQIIFLRLFDVVFFLGGVLLFRRALQAARISRLMSNVALGFFMAIPVAPFMAAQVNYDDLMVLLTGLSVLLAVQVVQTIKTTRQLPVQRLLWLLVTAVLASMVKYAYAPILLALTIFLVVVVLRYIGWRKLGAAIRPQLPTFKSPAGVVLVGACIIAASLFVACYGVNMVRYHTPTPECDQVLSTSECQAYEPYARNYAYTQGHYAFPAHKIAVYPFNNWIRGMVRSLFFVVGNKENGYPPGEPLLLAHAAAWVVLVGGALLVIGRGRWLWRLGIANQLFITVTLTYVGFLFLQNFMDFLHTHVAVAIQGRYLMPVMPLFLVLVAQAAGQLFRKRPVWAAGLLTVLIFCMLEGGGAVPYVVRFQDAWLWDAQGTRDVQHVLKQVVSPFIIGD